MRDSRLVFLPMCEIRTANVSTQIPISVSVYDDTAYALLTAVRSARQLQINRHFKKQSNSENTVLKKKIYQVNDNNIIYKTIV